MRSNVIKCTARLALAGISIMTSIQAIASDHVFGVLLMAHGGSAEWNQTVQEAVQPLVDKYPVEVAFGMADAVSLQDGIDRLEQQGVTEIGVVRMFVSGNSWYERTLQILGLQEGAPQRPVKYHQAAEGAGGSTGHGHSSSGGHSMEFWRVDSLARFAVSREGLADAEEVEGILLDRARSLSVAPANENLLIIAHGTQDDSEDAAWVEYISSRARLVRDNLAFNDIQVHTLREDWRQKRDVAEQQIREYVSASQKAGIEVIVVPFRVQGFGPYEEVLQGLPYRADKKGLTPHANIRDWIERQADSLRDNLSVRSSQT